MTTKRRKPKTHLKNLVDKVTGERLIPLVRVVPEDTYSIFCDGLVVQHTDDTFLLSFLQTIHPLAITDEEKANITELQQDCVARIVVTPAQMAKFLLTMDINFTKFLAKIGEDSKDFREFVEKYRKKDDEILNIG